MDLAVQVIDWKDANGKTWVLSFDVEPADGEQSYVGLTLRAAEGQVLTATVLRALANGFGTLTTRDTVIRRAFWREVDPTRDIRIRAARSGPPRKYESEEVARVWMEAHERGERESEAVMHRWGLKKSYASRLVNRARQEGYALPPKEGR